MKARFIFGYRIRTVIVKNRIVYIIPENNQPMRFDLNLFNSQKINLQHMPDGKILPLETIEQISKLHTDEEIMEDITKDYLADGWRKG